MKVSNLRFCRLMPLLALVMLSGCIAKNSVDEPKQSTTQNIAAVQTPPRALPENPASAVDELPDITEKPDAPPLVRLVVVSDMNGRYGSDIYDDDVHRSMDDIIADRPDIVINAGDMVAGQKNKLNYRKMWAGFHQTVTDRLSQAGIPMAQVVGNHDGSAYPKYAKEREIYIDEWMQHKPALDFVDDSAYPLYYAFMLNGIFFVALDASTLDPLDDVQFEWLKKQLAENPSKYRPVVFFHVPLFPITTIKPTEILRDKRLHPLFVENRVQLVINGHQQAYFPAKLDGVIYLHAGALGGGPRPVRQNDGIAPKTLTFVNLYEDHAPYIDTHLVGTQNASHFNHNLLPTYIVFGNQILPRVDIDDKEAEFARDYMISPHMTKLQMKTLIEALKESGGNWARIPTWVPTQETVAPLRPDVSPDSAANE